MSVSLALNKTLPTSFSSCCHEKESSHEAPNEFILLLHLETNCGTVFAFLTNSFKVSRFKLQIVVSVLSVTSSVAFACCSWHICLNFGLMIRCLYFEI